MQVVCGPKCALGLAKAVTQRKADKEAADAKKRQRAGDRLRREQLKTKPELTKEAQKEFNRWVRLRDYELPCISCGRTPSDANLATGSRTDCGHYRSVGSMPSLRFEPLNAAGQCVYCNQHLSGNIVEYRKGVFGRIGPDKLTWLEGEHPAKNYTRDDLREIRDKYRKLANELQKQLNQS